MNCINFCFVRGLSAGFALTLVFANHLSAVISYAAETSIAIPGAPKGDLATELMQSRTYCRSMERHLTGIAKRFPRIKIETIAAQAAWLSSPFAGGCNAIEENFLTKGPPDAAEQLKKMDDKVWDMTTGFVRIETEEQAREFLRLTALRAKGEIEVEMVRANLLWNYKPFQEQPEKEFELGYTRTIKHTTKGPLEFEFQLPMSWKVEDLPKPEIMSFRNCWGHGNVWMTVLVSQTVDLAGNAITGQERFDAYTEAGLRAEYLTMGINLRTFTKTKVNSMPALMFTRDQLFEQLGQTATRAAEVVRAFKDDQQISFQINTMGPEGEPVAAERIKKNQALFRMIAGSMRVVRK